MNTYIHINIACKVSIIRFHNARRAQNNVNFMPLHRSIISDIFDSICAMKRLFKQFAIFNKSNRTIYALCYVRNENALTIIYIAHRGIGIQQLETQRS